MYMGRKNKKVKSKTTAAMAKRNSTCSWLMVTIDPKRYWSKLMELELFPLLMTIRDTASPVDMRMAVPISIKFL
jgi:hypothetical protein